MRTRRGRSADDARAKALAKEREKRRKTLIRTKYGQAPLKHSKKGIQSCIFAGAASFLLLLLLSSSFVTNGEVSLAMGFIGLVALGFSAGSFICGLRSFKERDKNYITSRIGTVWSAVLLIGMLTIFIRGLF